MTFTSRASSTRKRAEGLFLFVSTIDATWRMRSTPWTRNCLMEGNFGLRWPVTQGRPKARAIAGPILIIASEEEIDLAIGTGVTLGHDHETEGIHEVAHEAIHMIVVGEDADRDRAAHHAYRVAHVRDCDLL